MDTASWRTASFAVTIDLDDVPDDGRPGESDDVRPTVENVSGGLGDDTITGDNDGNHLRVAALSA